MYCPNWIFDIAVARTASEYLSSEIGVDAFAKKYAEGLSEIYNDVPVESILGPAEAMMLFLAEIEAGDMAVELLNDFCFYRLTNEAAGKPRKLKPLFGALEDGLKAPDINLEGTAKSFRAYVFALRSNTVPKAPLGWKLENDENVPKLAELAGKQLSVLDII